MTLFCVETGDTVCQTVPCLPSLIKCNRITVKDDNNNNIQRPPKEDDDVRSLMSALGLKLKQQQKPVVTSSVPVIPVTLPITSFKCRIRKKISDRKNEAMPLCLLSLKKYDVREPIYYVVTDLKKIPIVKHYEKYCVVDSLEISNTQAKRSVEKNSRKLVYSSQRPDVLRPKYKKDAGLNKRLENCSVSENIRLRGCEVVLQRLKRSYVEYLIETQQVEYKQISSSPVIKSKTAITTTTVKKPRSRTKKWLPRRSPSPLNENKPQSSLPTTKRKMLIPKSPCDLTELTSSNIRKRRKTISIDKSDYLTEDVAKAPLLQTPRPVEFDSICLKCLQQPAMKGGLLNIFITYYQELKEQQEQMVVISDDDDEDIICLD
ncbi:unnamed protein product [Didymodactylos carnosus]|uniref:Uncharacterized protein n=1 Tax=Didymodactylos carnosus TaxID=1234261 RepID=A0A813ZTF6_9BILA|nr:unnamed protein product [Didymodactylos carnosus]CAF0904200.1 unnamed protein product [Didymodactylos carnosus]CAF3607498.1 unnamed protein product [Didymodactylos carnosus]CAF3686236.1 unnamed protein product [Didymodactylos carnosus]